MRSSSGVLSWPAELCPRSLALLSLALSLASLSWEGSGSEFFWSMLVKSLSFPQLQLRPSAGAWTSALGFRWRTGPSGVLTPNLPVSPDTGDLLLHAGHSLRRVEQGAGAASVCRGTRSQVIGIDWSRVPGWRRFSLVSDAQGHDVIQRSGFGPAQERSSNGCTVDAGSEGWRLCRQAAHAGTQALSSGVDAGAAVPLQSRLRRMRQDR